MPFKPTHKISLAIEKIRNNAGYYGDPMCLELRKAIETAYGINRDQIICGNGSEISPSRGIKYTGRYSWALGAARLW